MRSIFIRAVSSMEKLEIIYMSADGIISQRVIKVIAVTDRSIKVYCYMRRQFRTLKLNNFLSAAPFRKKIGA